MWRKLILNLSRDCLFAAPASGAGIRAAERVALPDDLRALLSESNGVQGEHGLRLIWPAERIAKSNLELRQERNLKELYMPFEPLLFFADAGNGDRFAFTIFNGLVRRPAVFVWNHEDDSRTWAAPSLQLYLQWWLSGKLQI